MKRFLTSTILAGFAALTFSVAGAQTPTSGGASVTLPSEAVLGEEITVDVVVIVPAQGIQNGPIEISILISNGSETLVFCSGSIEFTGGQNPISTSFSCTVPTDLNLGDHS
ncbi:MAG: hypothetical protein IIB00_06505, partial [candidate division Zixibacteria bacterium]|nr:hypothetical protein [candidate division Zixibacteria bacterium]